MADPVIRAHCGDKQKHKPHKWSGPNPDPKKTTQVIYQCPGSQ
jgi:hypothetical protein